MPDEAGDASLDDFRRLREGDLAARDRVLEAHHWVAVHCARRFADRGEPFDDLVQVGHLALLRALDRFDPDYGASFASFAVPTVLGEIRRYFRDATWAVRVPRRLKDLHVEIGAAREVLARQLSRPATPDELAEHLGLGVDDVLEALEAGGGYRPTPLAPVSSDDGNEPAESTVLRVDDEGLAGAEDRILVERLLAGLPERERRIVELRFFGELSQAEIAEAVGLSQVHVSRLLRSSLADLQRAAGDDVPEDFVDPED